MSTEEQSPTIVDDEEKKKKAEEKKKAKAALKAEKANKMKEKEAKQVCMGVLIVWSLIAFKETHASTSTS